MPEAPPQHLKQAKRPSPFVRVTVLLVVEKLRQENCCKLEAVWAVKEMGGGIYDLVLSKRETEAGRREDTSKWFLSCSSTSRPLWVTAGTVLGCTGLAQPSSSLGLCPLHCLCLEPAPRASQGPQLGRREGGVLGVWPRPLLSQLCSPIPTLAPL